MLSTLFVSPVSPPAINVFLELLYTAVKCCSISPWHAIDMNVIFGMVFEFDSLQKSVGEPTSVKCWSLSPWRAIYRNECGILWDLNLYCFFITDALQKSVAEPITVC